MKFIHNYLLIFFFTLMNSSCQSQSKCACLEDYQHNDGVLGTALNISEKKGETYLTFHCASVMRLYVNNEEGHEIEKNELDCISTEKIMLKLTKDFEYFQSNENSELTQIEIQQIFLDKIKSDPKQFYQFTLNEKKEIIGIYDFWMPKSEN